MKHHQGPSVANGCTAPCAAQHSLGQSFRFFWCQFFFCCLFHSHDDPSDWKKGKSSGEGTSEKKCGGEQPVGKRQTAGRNTLSKHDRL